MEILKSMGTNFRWLSQLSMSERDQDYALVQRVQAGEKAAFDILVLKYQHKLVGIISRFVKDSMEVEDVAQEAFIKAYRGLKNFRGDSAFYTWLYRIGVNTAKNYLTSKGRRVSADGVDAQEAEQYEGVYELQEHDTPEGVMVSEEVKHSVYNSIEQLPEDLKEAIVLRELEGMSYEEIAEAMSCPIGTVRSRIFRAREAIEKKLRVLSGDEDE